MSGEVGREVILEKGVGGVRGDALRAEPGTDGRSEAFLFAVNDVAREEAFCGALEQVFGGFSAKFEGVRKAAGEVGDFDVEAR